MASLQGKIAIVTGASSGIGADTAKALALAGAKVVALARRENLLQELSKTIPAGTGKIYPYRADITKEEDILGALKWTTENVGPLNYLINNAGMSRHYDRFVDMKTEDIQAIISTNLVAVAVASREAIKIMQENNIDGHIVNVNSVAGHRILNFPGIAIYTSSKHALTALTESLRLELVRNNSKIKITSVSPGGVVTDFAKAAGISLDNWKVSYKMLDGVDVADSILYVLRTPPHVQITEITLQGVGEGLA